MNVGDNWRGWTIEELLGEGAFGQVFKIVRHEMGHDYYSALKVIHVPQGKSEYNALENQGMSEREIEVYLQDIVHDFSRELSVMDELKGNSNIVSYENHLIEQSPDGKSWTIYIRMELLTPLLKFYKYNYPDEEEIIKLGLDICSALEVCRLNKIIHRDIKPANIFVAKFGDYKLGDFGIARKLENTKSGLSKKGTYTYMAPEVYLGKPYNHTVDIYSLGIVLYILLNDNRAPFVPAPPEIPRYNEYDSALQRRMRGEALPPPRNASPELAKVVLKACAYDSRDRYQTPTELKNALKAVLNKPRVVEAPAAAAVEKPKPVKAETAQPKQKGAQPKPVKAETEPPKQKAAQPKPETATQLADKKKPETVTEYADRKKPETVTFQQEDIPFKPLTVKQSAYDLKKPEYADRKKFVTAPPKPNNLSVPVQGTEAEKPKRKKGWKKAVIIPAVCLLVVVAIVLGITVFQKPNTKVTNDNSSQAAVPNTTVDTEPQTEPDNRQQIFEAYSAVLDRYSSNSGEKSYYTYDIDSNGTVELIVDTRYPHSERKCEVYTFDDQSENAVLAGIIPVGNGGLIDSYDIGLVYTNGENEVYQYNKVTMNDKKIGFEYLPDPIPFENEQFIIAFPMNDRESLKNSVFG